MTRNRIFITAVAICMLTVGQSPVLAKKISKVETINLARVEQTQSDVIASQAPVATNILPLTNSTSQTADEKSTVVEVSSKTPPKLKAPVVEDTTKKATTKHAVSGQKLNLKAVIFDPNADFKAEAQEEGREMTRLESSQEAVHEALHGEVQSMSKMNRKGLLHNYLTFHPEAGPVGEISIWGFYKGYMSNVWDMGTYKNTLYSTDSDYVMIDGKFKNPKWKFRAMLLYNKGKAGHDFFNDCWGDEYITYDWSKTDQFLLGNSRDALGIEGSQSPTILDFFTRSQIARTYNNTRSLGFKALGNHKYYTYNVGLFSAGRYFTDWFPGPEFIGQIGLKPLAFADGKYGNLLIGADYEAGKSSNSYNVATAFLDYEYKRLNLTLEYGEAHGSNGTTGITPKRSEGFVGTIKYRITPKLQILGRFDQFDPNLDKGNDMRREYTAGINYFIKGQSLRLTLNYVYYTVANGTYGSKIMSGFQVIW